MAGNGLQKCTDAGADTDKYHTMFLSLLTLAVALSLSVIAAYYSIAGLAAIFAAAVVPIMIMGSILEMAKIVVTLWLHEHWSRCRWLMKAYLVPAVFMLMVITSMGIFGFLSKAHSDQSMVSGDVQAKIALYDEKIKISKDNIDANRKALKQLDEAVDQVMVRSTDEKGADKAVAIRRGQQKERGRLLAEIEAEQKKISSLNEARAPIAAEVRKVEAEVGPIKYIAALIYGDNADNNMLEKAVSWVIILLVVVFDPLAIMMLLAATESLKWTREKKQAMLAPFAPAYEPDDGPLTDEQLDQLNKSAKEDLPVGELKINDELFTKDPHPPGWMFTPVTENPTVDDTDNKAEPIACYMCGTTLMNAPGIGLFCPNKQCDVMDNTTEEVGTSEHVMTPSEEQELEKNVTEEWEKLNVEEEQYVKESPVIETVDIGTEPSIVDEKENTKLDANLDDESDQFDDMDTRTKEAAQHWKTDNPGRTLKFQRTLYNSGRLDQLPWMVEPYYSKLMPDNSEAVETNSGFGIAFPSSPNKGDSYLRVDRLPSALYKFNGTTWIEVDKLSNYYIYDDAYIDHLIAKISSGEYDPELLSDAERDQIEQRLRGK